MTVNFAGVSFPQLDQVMRGIKRSEAEKGTGKKQRLPISPIILHKLWEVWSKKGDEHDIKMLWAACCLCFFAFLRAGEMTVPSDKEYDEAVHLSVKDVAVDNSRNPSVMQIRIKQSKTDPFRQLRNRIICGKNWISSVSGVFYDGLPAGARHRYTRSSLSFCGWPSIDTATVCQCRSRGTEEGGGRFPELLRTQFPYRCRYYGDDERGGQSDH